MNQYDLELTADGRMPIYPRLVTGREKVRQALLIAMRTHRGEWLADVTRGLPFAQWTSTLIDNVQVIGGVIRQEIASVAGVQEVTSFRIDRRGRTITATATVRLVGEELDFGIGVENLEVGPHGNALPLVWLHLDSRRFYG